MSDTWARQEYFRWAERKTDQVAAYGKEPQDVVLKSLSLDAGEKTVTPTACARLQILFFSPSTFAVEKMRLAEAGGTYRSCFWLDDSPILS